MRSKEDILRFESRNVRNTYIESIIDLYHFVLIFCAECKFHISNLYRLIFAETCLVERLVPVRLFKLDLITDCLVDSLFLLVRFDAELILIDLHVG
jgi:hypothetical protein